MLKGIQQQNVNAIGQRQMGLHMALRVQPGHARKKEMNWSWNWDKVLQRCSEDWRTGLEQTLFALAKWRWRWDMIAVLKHCGWWMKIAEPQVLQLMVNRQVWLRDGISFQVRAFDLKVWILAHLFVARSFGSWAFIIASPFPWQQGRGNHQIVTWMQPGNSAISPHGGRDGHGCTYTWQCSEFYTLFRYSFSSLYATKAAKDPKRKKCF